MLGKLYGLDIYHGAWSQCSRDTVLGGEAVDTEHHGIYKITYRDTWDASIYKDELRVQ